MKYHEESLAEKLNVWLYMFAQLNGLRDKESVI